MIESVLAMDRKDFWDIGGIGGLLKGKLFQEAIEKNIRVHEIENCPIPFAATAYDTIRFRTRKISSGNIATAARASCTFPGLFQPVIIDGTPHIDGGVWDWVGLMALEECIVAHAKRMRAKESIVGESTASVNNQDETYDIKTLFPENSLIVNVVFGSDYGSKLAPEFSHARLLTVVVENIPDVTPFTMTTAGLEAYKLAKAAMHRALFSCHIQELGPNHWAAYVDGKGVHNIPRSILEHVHEHTLSSARNSVSDLSAAATVPGVVTPAISGAPPATATAVTGRTHTGNVGSLLSGNHFFADATIEEEEEGGVVPMVSSSGNSSSVSFSLPSLHLPNSLENGNQELSNPIPSYSFINGRYVYQALHHGVNQASGALQSTLSAMQTTMTSTLQSITGVKRRREDMEDEEEAEDDAREIEKVEQKERVGEADKEGSDQEDVVTTESDSHGLSAPMGLREVSGADLVEGSDEQPRSKIARRSETPPEPASEPILFEAQAAIDVSNTPADTGNEIRSEVVESLYTDEDGLMDIIAAAMEAEENDRRQSIM